MAYRAFVFIRPSGPQIDDIELGHVGWGFQIDATRYLVGAVENPSGGAITPPGKTGLWTEVTTDPFARFAAGPLGEGSAYDAYKEIPVEAPQIAAAQARVQELATQGYAVVGGNCMDAVYAVLRDYGIWHLPNPSLKENYLPNAWFQHIAFPVKALMPRRGFIDAVLYEHPEYQGARLQLVSNAQTLKTADLAGQGWLRRASSVVIRSGRLTLFTGAQFTGSSVLLNSGTAYPFLGGWARMSWSLSLEAVVNKRVLSLLSAKTVAPLAAPAQGPAIARAKPGKKTQQKAAPKKARPKDKRTK